MARRQQCPAPFACGRSCEKAGTLNAEHSAVVAAMGYGAKPVAPVRIGAATPRADVGLLRGEVS